MSKETNSKAVELSDEETEKVSGGKNGGALEHHCLNSACGMRFPLESTVCPNCKLSCYETISMLPGRLPSPIDME